MNGPGAPEQAVRTSSTSRRRTTVSTDWSPRSGSFDATVDTLSTTAPVILQSSYYSYLDAFGLLNGTDTLILSAPG